MQLLSLRVKPQDLAKFKTRCEKLNKPYQIVIREMIEAFNQNRLTIQPDEKQKELLKIYKENNK